MIIPADVDINSFFPTMSLTNKRDIIGGSTIQFATMAEVCALYPMDLVKTRLQANGSPYRGIFDCFRQILIKESPRGLFNGVAEPLLFETIKRATKFYTFEQCKHTLEPFIGGYQMHIWTAGLMSGITEGVLFCPVEQVKVQTQSTPNRRMTSIQNSKETWREIVRTNGITGLYHGLGATLCRHAIWNFIFFGLSHNFKAFFAHFDPEASRSIWYRFSAGSTAAIIASVANVPFDVAKCRIQGPQPEFGRLYHSTWQTIGLIYRNEGFAALYRGLWPKVLRMSPAGGLMFVLFDNEQELVKELILNQYCPEPKKPPFEIPSLLIDE